MHWYCVCIVVLLLMGVCFLFCFAVFSYFQNFVLRLQEWPLVWNICIVIISNSKASYPALISIGIGVIQNIASQTPTNMTHYYPRTKALNQVFFFLLIVMYLIPKLWLWKDTCILGIIKWQRQHFQKCPCKELEVNYDILYELDVFDCRKLFCRSFVAPGNPVVNNWLVHSPVLFLLQRKEVFSLPPH